MSTYVQADRPLAVATPLGQDALLLVGFTGREALSQLFHFQLELLAENRTVVAFDKLLGQMVGVRLALPDGQQRFFHGLCNRVSQGQQDHTFTHYRMTLVPPFWLLTKRVQSRIFQHLSVPDILKKVLDGLDVAYELVGTFHPRDYCVQYRESDFAFASRLMEEEGIYYFFKHTADSHKLVVANTPQSHPPIPVQSRITFEEAKAGARETQRITQWEKAQELRAGKYTLWDHSFELPHQHLEAEKTIVNGVAVGRVGHQLKVGGNDRLEIYDFPGAYAQRFDGVDKGGGDQAAELEKIFEDNQRTVALRLQQETLPGLEVHGAGTCRQLVSGHKFTLERHFNADGDYLLTSVEHAASLAPNYRSGVAEELIYENRFTCIPLELPFRPQRTTPKPIVQGTQTAVVVGPPGEEIYTDKYGRVKVQFHWDREGQFNADSSCWIRVATIWAGKTWGVIHVPRIGHEVVVAFEEGDPDQPIIVGSVYNADHMPPGQLPKEAMVSGLRSNSTPGGGGYNGMMCDDTKGKEQITVHAQYDMSTTVEHDDTQTVHNNRTITVDGTHTETIKKDTTITITEGKYSHDVVANTADYHVQGKLTEKYDNDQDTTVQANVFLRSATGTIRQEALAESFFIFANKGVEVKSNTDFVHVFAATEIKLQTGSSVLHMKSDGTILLQGDKIEIKGGTETKIGVASQNVVCDKQKTAVSGAAINASAVGMHEITGALVKIN